MIIFDHNRCNLSSSSEGKIEFVLHIVSFLYVLPKVMFLCSKVTASSNDREGLRKEKEPYIQICMFRVGDRK